MRKLKSHEWDELIYIISGSPTVICGLVLLYALVYEQVNIAIVLIGN